MAEGGSSNFGLSAEEFHRLSQLEEAAFLAIRDGKILANDYLNFMRFFMRMEKEDFMGKSNEEIIMAIIETERSIGQRIKIQGKGAANYILQFRKFLEIRGIKIDFRKTPLR